MSWFSELPASTQGALIVAGAALASGFLSFLGVLGAVVLKDFWAAPRNWFSLIEKMLDSVDLRWKEGTDARVAQLHKALIANVRILVSVANVEERPGSVSEVTVKAAEEVLRDHEQEAERDAVEDASNDAI